jgi:lactate dehydrogenase-like 2-hydroxyacid dehydrogenase
MTKPRILQIGSLSGSPIADAAVAERYTVLPLWLANDKAAYLREQAADIEVIVTSAVTGLKADVINALPNLKAICSWGVGYDSIDVDAAKARNVMVSNTPEVLDDCVADIAWGLLLGCSRQIAWGDRFVRANHWENKTQSLPLGSRVSGKKLGIVGLGNIGAAIARRGLGFDMQVAYHNRRERKDLSYPYYASLIELAKWSDFLVVATVGGPSTRLLINEEVLRALGPHSLLINIARGSVVDEAALVKVLQEGSLGGAGLDVFDQEPKVPDALKTMNNVVLMPHVASATAETRQAMLDLVLKNLEAFFKTGNVITPVL